MDKRTRKALEADGWKIGTVQELLELSDEDSAFVEMKVALAEAVRDRRKKAKVSQTRLAAQMGSSQSRVANLEKGQGTMDLMVRALLAMGVSPKEIGRKLGAAGA